MTEKQKYKYEEALYSSKVREKLAQKNGSNFTFYYINGDRYLGDWKDGNREGIR